MLDLESYVGLYSGRGQINRLFVIARKVPELREEALNQGFALLKQRNNTHKFREMWNEFCPGQSLDATTQEWLLTTENANKKRLDKLNKELSDFKVTMIKESIRKAHHALGDLYFAMNDHTNALKQYMRTRDHGVSSAHTLEMCLAVIRVGVETDNMVNVTNYVNKAESSINAETRNPRVSAMLRAAAGLAFLRVKKFRQAANSFLECTIELGDSFNEVISCSDVALYGTLCALASFERAELRSKVIENATFKHFLELVPEAREILNSFSSSRYGDCFRDLTKLQERFAVDIHLHDIVDELLKFIRHRALVQYFVPYSKARLPDMAQTFDCDPAELQKELLELIKDGQIVARIDTKNQVLVAHHPDRRDQLQERVECLSARYHHEMVSMLVRANCVSSGIVVKGTFTQPSASGMSELEGYNTIH